MKPSKKGTVFFYVLIRAWKSFKYFNKCIDSVFQQNYKNYEILFVDDASGYSIKQKKYIKEKLKGHVVIFNMKRRYSIYNAYNLIHKYTKDDEAVIFGLDGDDWLLGKNALSIVAKIYERNNNCALTYGDCLLWDGQLSKKSARYIWPCVNCEYSKEVINRNSYRKEPFIPLGPRTWKVWLFKKIAKKDFLDTNGKWLRFAEDHAIFYPMLEMAIKNLVINKIPLYVYNITNTHRDVNENTFGVLRDELTIRKKIPYKSII